MITPPINAAYLFAPLPRGLPWHSPTYAAAPAQAGLTPPAQFDTGHLRSAYDDQSLARVLRDGVNPDGRTLDDIMPRFRLDDADMAALIGYLHELNAQISPGVTPTTIRFATIVGDDVPAAERDAFLATLQAYVRAKNAQPRNQERRARAGPFYRRENDLAYRQLDLAVWRLQGPPSGWGEQLEAQYRAEPVFAVLSGVVAGSWAPIHAFCERHGIPTLFPITERPVIADHDWYTLYLSRGFYGEGEGAARFLHRERPVPGEPVVAQVYRSGSDGEAAAEGFARMWGRLGHAEPASLALEDSERARSPTTEAWLSSRRPDVLLVWLGDETKDVLEALPASPHRPTTVVVSAGMLREHWSSIPGAARSFTYVTYPYAFLEDKTATRTAVERWLEVHDVALVDLRLQADVYFLGRMLSGILMEMRNNFYRDYFLDNMDMIFDQDYTVVSYPRLTFGPGQRYASKGCYVVQLTEGDAPSLRKVGDWIVH